jgi:hypothetical protein
MALVAVVHLRGDWVADSTDSHPGILARLVVLTKWTVLGYEHIVAELLATMPGELRLHRLAAELTAFAVLASGMRPDMQSLNTPVELEPIDMPVTITNYLHQAVILSDLDSYRTDRLLVENDAS